MRRKTTARGCVIAFFGAMLGVPALLPAQTAIEATDTKLQEVVVTAQRRSESLQDVPMTVDVASGQELQSLNLFDFKDLQRLAPGLELTNNDGRSNIATLRGVTFNPDSGTLPSVDVYFNDIRTDAQTAFTSIYDVQQMEVLRGPQGIFRGATSPAGAITLTTARPNLNSVDGYFMGTGTTEGGGNGQGAISIPIIPGVLAVRASGLYDTNRNNDVFNVNTNQRSRADTESGRLSIEFQPSSAFNALLTWQYLSSNVRPYIAVFGPGNQPSLLSPALSGPPITIDQRLATSEGAPEFRNHSNLVTLGADWHLNDTTTLSINGGYQNTTLGQTRDLDATNAVPGYDQQQYVNTPYKQSTIDVRLASAAQRFFNWMVGGYYSSETNDVTVVQPNNQLFGLSFTPLPASAAFPVDVSIYVPVKNSTTAGFGTVDLQFTPKLSLEAGVRYTHWHIDQQSFLTVTLPTLGINTLDNFPTISPQNAIRSYDSWTGGASLSYKWTDSLTNYVSYGHSFRPGSAAVGVTVPLPQNLLLSNSETSDSIELGLKSEWLNQRLVFNTDVFYQKFTGYIDHLDALFTSTAENGVLDSSPSPINTNGDASTRGVEAQLESRLTPDLDLSASAAYINAHYDNALVPCNVFDSNGIAVVPVGQVSAECIRNDALSQVPKFTASLNGEYRFHTGKLEPFIRGLATYRPGFFSSYDNYDYSSYTDLSLFLGVRDANNKWEVSLFSKNLLDQTRALRVSQSVGQYGTAGLDPVTFQPTGGPGAPFVSGYRSAVITLPREFGITARVNF